MSREKINNSDLKKIGISQTEHLKRFGKVAKRLHLPKRFNKNEILSMFKQLLDNPEVFISSDNELKELAEFVLSEKEKRISFNDRLIQLLKEPLDFKIYGEGQIEDEALQQMRTAMSLPVTRTGALMPDAHSGYGLPIGGVLATEKNIVIPYAVGVDIACRMCMTIYDLPGEKIEKQKEKLKEALCDNTFFGVGSICKNHLNNIVFDHPDWQSTKVIRSRRDLAYSQLGTSGAGNHFVEWGILEITSESKELDIPAGSYLALLSHSGSRGFGSEIASYYSKLAMKQIKLPQEARHLAWLYLDSEEGHEYWVAMNLAGLYASANHHEIHDKITQSLGLKPLIMFENHHNFAWKEKLNDGTEVIVHRKGATPAGENDIGIIPGSMTRPGFVIKGKGNTDSLKSASHGAGRVMSRNKAFERFTFDDLNRELKKYGVELIGGDIDEAPMVYKNIDTVIALQADLVDIIAKFYPKIVQMVEPERRRR
jgi:tRNA-splicing ligase RtcB